MNLKTTINFSALFNKNLLILILGFILFGCSSNGTTPEPPKTFVDERDGQVYKYAEFGTQTWMIENLNYTGYTNSSPGSPVYYHDYELDNACPAGWHVPIMEEWVTLIEYCGGVENNRCGFNLEYDGGVITKPSTAFPYETQIHVPPKEGSAYYWVYDYYYVQMIVYFGKIPVSLFPGTSDQLSIRCIKDKFSDSISSSSTLVLEVSSSSNILSSSSVAAQLFSSSSIIR